MYRKTTYLDDGENARARAWRHAGKAMRGDNLRDVRNALYRGSGHIFTDDDDRRLRDALTELFLLHLHIGEAEQREAAARERAAEEQESIALAEAAPSALHSSARLTQRRMF